ncbi:MAG TPA: UDP-N-acetylglucosamine 2-epimerase (hydrolyzing) [Sulfurospirillum arcachonense]|nr:UDP-N-acetylglucosamine 2-epimerase (hydrolyzing) [Sulfurospirillum arcachonense]
MSKRKICVVTGARAEYGLFYPILKRIQDSGALELQLIATTMHLSEEFGSTYKQIENDGFKIDETIENLLSPDSKSAIAKSAGLATILLTDAYARLNPDIVLLLGDRYETHAAATTAMLMNIPIAHIHGGEITEGAVDEQIRHSITKMSYLHFTSTKAYQQRVIQLGEDPSRVFVSGAPGVDNIVNLKLLSKAELEGDINWEFGEKSALFTYHPVTLADNDINDELNHIFTALGQADINILFTYANADDNGRAINQKIEKICQTNPSKYKVVKSLGQLRYLSAMKYVDILIGNTSSGIIEASSFQKPVVNIGDRQKGRLQSGNIIDCSIETLKTAISHALSSKFQKNCKTLSNIYGNGDASDTIVDVLSNAKLSIVKKFVDMDK